MVKIVVLTGSFNPVTCAHYEILSDAVKKCDADEGLFVLTSDKYLAKKNLVDSKCPSSFMLSEDQRSELINSLKADNPKLSCWGVESGGSSSNTCGTLRKILKDKKKQYAGEEVRLYYTTMDLMHRKRVWHVCQLFHSPCISSEIPGINAFSNPEPHTLTGFILSISTTEAFIRPA